MASKPPPNPYIAGPPIGSQPGFFGREEIFEEVERTLRHSNRNSVILHGQRRIGKTSLLLQLERRLPSPPFFTVYFDLTDKALLPMGQVLHEIAAAAADIAEIPTPAASDFENDSAVFDKDFLPALRQALGDQRQPVFLLDEFGVLDTPEQELEPTAAVRGLDDYFYDLLNKQNYANFIFAAGRRMKELSSVVESSFKADLTRFISVLNPEQAEALILQKGVEGIPSYDEAAIGRILALTRGHPYLTQRLCYMLFERAYDHSPRKPQVTVKDVEAAATEFLETDDESLTLIWNSLAPAEHITLAAMAGRATEMNEILSEGDIKDALNEAGISPEARSLGQAPRNLVRWQMLERLEQGYRFFIKLMLRWIARRRPLEQIKEEELVHLDPAAEVLYQAAQQSYEEGNNQQAIAQLYRALAINPNHLPARMLLGTILSEEEQPAEAVAQYEEAYKLDRTTALAPLVAALLLLGAALEEAGNYPDALAAYDRVLALELDNKTAKARRKVLQKKLSQADKAKVIPVTKTGKDQRQKERRGLRTALIIAAILIPLLLCLFFFLSGNNPFGTNQRATTIAQANTATAAAAAQIAATDTAATVSAIAAARTATSEASQATPTVEQSSTSTPDAQTAAQNAAATATAAAEATKLAAPVSQLSGQIRVVGSNAMQPVIEALAKAFTETHPNVEVSIQTGDSKAGIEAVQQDAADIGMVSRELDEAEAAGLSDSQRITLAENDVIAIITHVLVSVDNLSTEQVQGIFTGEITNWSQVGGADVPIVIVTGDKNSDTRTAFEQTLLGQTGGINVTESIIEAPSDQALRNIVSNQPYAIGYTPLRLTGVDSDISPDSQNWAVLDTALLEVKVLTLDQLEPSLENATSGAYPLTRPLNIITQEQPGEPVRTWLEFISSPEGQAIVESMGHTPASQ